MNSHINNNTSISTLPPPVFIPCDNPRNIISPHVAAKVDLVMYAGIFPALVPCGIITNIINMIVFARQGLRDRIHVCLFSLALSDTGFLLTMVCGKSYVLIGLIDPAAGSFWKPAHMFYCSNLAFVGVSNAITAIIALERCLCVLSPLKAARFLRTKYTVAMIMVIGVYIVVIKHTIHALKFRTVKITDPLTNFSTYISRLSTPYLRHRTLIDILYLYSVSVALPCISLVVVIACTTAIILRLRATSSWRQTSMANRTSKEKQEVALTRMLVTVCCVYVLCMTPSVARVLLLSSLRGFLGTGYLCNVYRVSTAICLFLESINAAVNFPIYLKQSSQYRATLGQPGCCWGRQKVKREVSVASITSTEKGPVQTQERSPPLTSKCR